MKAIPYNWINNPFDNDATVQQNTEEVSATKQISSDNITQIVQLVEKLIDLTIDDSVRAEQVTKQLLQQADMI